MILIPKLLGIVLKLKFLVLPMFDQNTVQKKKKVIIFESLPSLYSSGSGDYIV